MAELDDVSLSLASDAGRVDILTGITARLERGRSISLTGPSGSGKTSLLMLLGGLEKPTTGQIRIDGTDITAMDEDRLAIFRRNHIGIVFQNFHLIPTMTALENTALSLELAGDKNALDHAAAALARVGLGHRLRHYPAQLSGGEQQRVAIARATVARPHLILADEPTGNLDAATGRDVIDLLFGLGRDTGATLLLITHDPALAAACDRQLHISDGRITV